MKKWHFALSLTAMIICAVMVMACQFSKNATVSCGSSGSVSGSVGQESDITLPENMDLAPIAPTITSSSLESLPTN